MSSPLSRIGSDPAPLRSRHRTGAGEPSADTGAPATSLSALRPGLQAAFARLDEQVAALQRDLDEARQRIRELEQQTETDDLVPVANRRGFARDIERALADVERHDLSAAILFLDVNRMKAINDTHGHLAGDRALVQVADTLKAQLRTSDSVARIGGDEFAVLLTHVEEAEARAKARALVAGIADAPVAHEGGTFRVSASVGLQMLKAGQTAASLLSQADRAMYAEKRNMTEGDQVEAGITHRVSSDGGRPASL